MYIRTVEPHKDGVPHFHMLLYIPYEHIEQFKKDFIKSYPAPQNRRIKDSKKFIKDYKINNQELESFQTDIKDTTAYVMKYILKSFMDVKNQKNIDYIQAWYIKHRIMRCVTSKSIVPQWVYQKAYAFENDWYHLTDLMNDKSNHVEWSREDNYFYFIDNYTGRELIYQYGKYQIVYGDRVIKEIGEVKEKNVNVKVYDKTPAKWTKKEKPVPTYKNDNLIGYFLKEHGFKSLDKKPYQMKDFQLVQYFGSIDIETVNETHYAVTKNLMIDRGLLLNTDKLDLRELQDFKEF